ncbi:hypothetical protein Tco_0403619 [Tanacetum coccineum]
MLLLKVHNQDNMKIMWHIKRAVMRPSQHPNIGESFIRDTELTSDSNINPYILNSVNSSEPTLSIRPTNVEVPKELPKVSMVNTSLKKLKHLILLNMMCSTKKDTPTSITEAQSQEKDTVIKKLKERIKSLSGKMDKDKIKQDLEEIETINIELDHREKALAKTTLKDEVKELNRKALVDNNPCDLELHQSKTEPTRHERKTQPTGNTKKDKIHQTPSSTQKNKCNGCMLSDNHDLCVLDFINNVNARAKSKSVKKNSKRKVWKPTGKASSPIFLLSKPLKQDPLVWHQVNRSSYLNFGAINHLARHSLVRGLPKLKFEKDHLCSACALGKSMKKPHKPKSEDTNQEKLYLCTMGSV